MLPYGVLWLLSLILVNPKLSDYLILHTVIVWIYICSRDSVGGFFLKCSSSAFRNWSSVWIVVHMFSKKKCMHWGFKTHLFLYPAIWPTLNLNLDQKKSFAFTSCPFLHSHPSAASTLSKQDSFTCPSTDFNQGFPGVLCSGVVRCRLHCRGVYPR